LFRLDAEAAFGGAFPAAKPCACAQYLVFSRWSRPRRLVTSAEIVAHLRSLRSPRDIEGMRRFGITTACEQLGVSAPALHALARLNRRNHALALELWESAIHEARVLAALVDDPARVTRSQMERWARQCDNWAQTDACSFGISSFSMGKNR
jgi:3-methyladenine DNA glycosylase AlkD